MEDVGAVAAIEAVVAVAGVNDVTAVAAGNGVVAIAAVDRIGAVSATDHVIAVGAGQGALSIAAVDHLCQRQFGTVRPVRFDLEYKAVEALPRVELEGHRTRRTAGNGQHIAFPKRYRARRTDPLEINQ